MERSADQKGQCRQIIRERLRQLAPEARAQWSKQICERILGHPTFQAATSILLYVPLKDEVDLEWLFETSRGGGKQLALPRFLPETGHYSAFLVGDKPLIAGAFGILEPASDLPVPLNRLDFVVVPGVGFDARGRRLGRGKGFYDRLLSEAAGVKCGVCFDEQLLDSIPVEPHDVGVHFLATPSRWLDCRGSTLET